MRALVKIGRCWVDPDRVEAVEEYDGIGGVWTRVSLFSGTRIYTTEHVDEVLRILHAGRVGV